MKCRNHLICLVVALGIAPFVGLHAAEPGVQTNAVRAMTPQEIQSLYDSMEERLTSELREDRQLDKTQRTQIILALGHLRSAKAVPYLLASLEFSPQKVALPDGHEVLVGRATYEATYPAIAALKQIGSLSSDNIIGLIAESVEGSQREMLLTKLGLACHGKVFVHEVREKLSTAGPQRARWKRVADLLPADRGH